MPPVPQKIARTIPESGRIALLIGNHATHVIDRPIADGDSIGVTFDSGKALIKIRSGNRYRDSARA